MLCDGCGHPPEAHSWGSTGGGPCRCGHCPDFSYDPPPQPDYVGAIAAIKELADKWRYKGEFGWGPWQTGDGPDHEGCVLDMASAEIREALGRYGCD